MYWYPYDDFRFAHVRQMMPSMDMERMYRMMERHMAATNEILRLVRENHRMLRAIHGRLITPSYPYPYPARGQEATGKALEEEGREKP